MTSTVSATTVPYALTRLGTLMTAEPGNPDEAEGVLNPAVARDRNGGVYLFPRLVGAHNASKIGRAQVLEAEGTPVAVRREGIALEPDRGWEHGARHGGIEDPRITWIESLKRYVMTYVAFGPTGPRTAVAVAEDLDHWQRLGPLLFDYDDDLDTDLNLFPNKDVVFFPEVVTAPDGVPSYAVLHRPMWDLGFTSPNEPAPVPRGLVEHRPSIWISYVPAADVAGDLRRLVRLGSHRFLAGPEQPWEDLKIGAGPAPVKTPEGWLLIYHGVTGRIVGSAFDLQPEVRYAAGAMILDPRDPGRVLARTAEPLLEPGVQEAAGVVPNVVFPTAIERFSGVDYVFYGMADSSIGVARLDRTDRAIPPSTEQEASR